MKPRRSLSALLGVAALTGTMTAISAAPAVATAGVVDATEALGGYYHESLDVYSALSGDITALGGASGRQITFGGTFMDVDENDNVPGREIPGNYNNTIVGLNGSWDGGATPFVNLMMSGSAASIAAGAKDADIAEWGSYVNRWLNGENQSGRAPEFAATPGRSLIIAPMPEANYGSGFGYQCDPANYQVAFRRVVDTLRVAIDDDTKVRFAFAPNGYTGCGGSMAAYYPGGAWVDLFGFSSYNWFGVAGDYSPSPTEVFLAPADELRAIDATKPQLVAQTAACTSNGSRDSFIADAFDYVKADTNLVGLIYFNLNMECDWRMWAGGAVNTSGWLSGMAGATYQFPLTNWFQGGTLVAGVGPAPADPCTGPSCDSFGLVDDGPTFRLRGTAHRDASQDLFLYGNPGDLAISGDWDCNGSRTPGMYRQSDGFVYTRDSNSTGVADRRFFLGNPGDYPIVGDFNGDGCDTVSVYRESTQQIFIMNALGPPEGALGVPAVTYVFGNPGDRPFTGDFDGDGIDTVGLHRESTGKVYYRNSFTTGVADNDFIFGDPGDILLAGDWNGNGTDTVAVYRPGNGRVYMKLTNAFGVADVEFPVGNGFSGFVRTTRVP